jgi:hypothetical protein
MSDVRDQLSVIGERRAEAAAFTDYGEQRRAEDRSQKPEVRRQWADVRYCFRKKAHARPFKDRFLKYNENIFFDGLRWYDFHRGCAS